MVTKELPTPTDPDLAQASGVMDMLGEAEHQRMPGDWEAQVGQGVITAHSEEHLATSDRGVAMMRRFWKRQVEAVARGEDPAGVAFDDAGAWMGLEAGNYLLE